MFLVMILQACPFLICHILLILFKVRFKHPHFGLPSCLTSGGLWGVSQVLYTLWTIKEIIYIRFKVSIIFMRWDRRSQSCSSGVLGYADLVVIRKLGSDGAILHWLLLIMFLGLPLAIWLSLVLVCLGDQGWSRPRKRQVELCILSQCRSPGRQEKPCVGGNELICDCRQRYRLEGRWSSDLSILNKE